MSSSAGSRLKISILVPTYARPDLARDLLTRLSAQTLPSSEFEVILVDDGSPTPLALDVDSYSFELRLIRQGNAGPAAARNTGIQHCRAPLTLILNDDAVPAEDLCEQHLLAHEASRSKGRDKTAVLGTFTFDEESLQSPFTQMLAKSDLLFSFSALADQHFFGWAFFWTCNLSLSTAALREVGGFDQELFDKAIVEDVELGYRLAAKGFEVLHWSAARCEHHHSLSPEAYDRRTTDLGVYLTRMYKKHGDREVLWGLTEGLTEAKYRAQLQTTCEQYGGVTSLLYFRVGPVAGSNLQGA